MEDSKRFRSISLFHTMCVTMLLLLQLGTYSYAREVKRDLRKQSGVEAYVDELTGFAELEGISKSFTQVDVNDDNTPFLHTQINSRKNVWRVEIRSVCLKLKSVSAHLKDKYLRDFEVLIDPNTGHLLRVTSTCDVNDPNMLPEPLADVAERQMRSNEIYHGFPNELPKISLLDALDVIHSKGPGAGPLMAKEIYAVYVMHSRLPESPMGWKPRPVWVITLRGIPPFRPIGPPHLPREDWPPVWLRNRIRHVVDAFSGEWLSANNAPHPLVPVEKKKK